MAVESTVPILFVQQMGPTGRLAHDLATHPEASQAMSRHLSEAALRQEAQQVQKMENSADSSAIKDEEKRQGAHPQQERRRHAKEPEEEQENAPSSAALHVGLLVNYKI